MSEKAVRIMSSKALHEQLTIIMGALTKAAVSEICEVVDEGYAVLQLEITRSYKENEDLKKKLHLIESIIVRGNGGKPATLAAVPAVTDVEATDQQDTAQDCDGVTTGDACNNVNVTAREVIICPNKLYYVINIWLSLVLTCNLFPFPHVRNGSLRRLFALM